MDRPPAGGDRVSAGAVSNDALLDVAVECARTAGALLLERFGSERVLATKSTSTDLVSAADLAAEAAIREILGRHAPDDAIMGEEGDDTPGTSGRRWIVDPLDGTVNFLYGLPQWCVSVACEGLVGVVFDPILDELFTATADGPAHLNGVALSPSPPEDLGHALVATGFGYDADRRALQADIVRQVLPLARDIRRGGSAALDLAWAAAGRLDAYYERGLNLWDIAAGELICSRAGLTTQRLEPTTDLPWGVLTAHPNISADLHAIVG
jgi:myo-inositol-1(or 4)-monophosphatase